VTVHAFRGAYPIPPRKVFTNNSEPIALHHFDLIITQAINALAGKSPATDYFLIMVSSVGVPIMVLAVASQWWRKENRMSVRHALVASGLTFLLALALNQIILLFIHRMRPYDAGLTHLLIAPSADFSFPSDHATASFAIAFAFLFHGLKRWGTAFAAAATLICFSRIFIGTHYFTDVMGGAVTAGFAAALVKITYLPDTRLDRLVTHIF
jgi:undecaprenyl-diphosphatase